MGSWVETRKDLGLSVFYEKPSRILFLTLISLGKVEPLVRNTALQIANFDSEL